MGRGSHPGTATRLRTKLATALISALICALVLFSIFRWRGVAASDVLAVRSYEWGDAESTASAGPGVHPLEAGVHDRFPPSGLVRREFTEAEADQLFQVSKLSIDVFDPVVGYRPKPGFRTRFDWKEHPEGGYWRTHNSLGMRGAEDPSPDRPDLRVLVVGDSHSDGVCNDTETYSARLQQALRQRHPSHSIEVLNAARGGYSLFQYLGTLERLLPLSPDVVVIGIYGGNDFEEGLTYHHFSQGTARPTSEPYSAQLKKCADRFIYSMWKALNSAKYFSYWTAQIDVALQAARDLCTEIQVVCLRHSIRPVFLYIPPLTAVEPERHEPVLQECCDDLELSEEALGITDRMADSLLAFLAQQGAQVIDLRPAYRASNTQLYWSADYHLNIAGHALAAEQLLAGFDWAPWVARGTVRTTTPAKVPKAPLGPNARDVHRLAFEVQDRARAKALTPLPREPLAPFEAHVAAAVRAWPQARYDVTRWTAWRPGFSGTVTGPGGAKVLLETDAEGLRVLPSRDSGPATSSVLVCGDENVACAASASDGLAGALQTELSVFPSARGIGCVDASAPGQFPDAYSATFSALASRDTRAVVVAFDTETDFGETARARRGPRQEEQRTGRVHRGGGLPVAKRQIVRHALDVLCELQRRCEEHGCTLVIAVLPARELDPGSIQQRMAGELVAALRERSIRVADVSRLVFHGKPFRDPGTGLVTPAILRATALAIAQEIVDGAAEGQR